MMPESLPDFPNILAALEAAQVCFVLIGGLDDLNAMKMAAGRPKDQLHLLELTALRLVTQDSGSADV